MCARAARVIFEATAGVNVAARRVPTFGALTRYWPSANCSRRMPQSRSPSLIWTSKYASVGPPDGAGQNEVMFKCVLRGRYAHKGADPPADAGGVGELSKNQWDSDERKRSDFMGRKFVPLFTNYLSSLGSLAPLGSAIRRSKPSDWLDFLRFRRSPVLILRIGGEIVSAGVYPPQRGKCVA